jgi:transposase
MFPTLGDAKIYLCREPIDMRKSYDTLSALVRSFLGEDPLSGSLFVFLNQPRNRVKILYYESGGMVIWMKRLECGTFALPLGEGSKQKISSGALAMLLDGLKLVQSKRYVAPSEKALNDSNQ